MYDNDYMSEVWKDVKGYEGYYQVSNAGRIKSVRYNKISYGVKDCSTGYMRYVLQMNKIKKVCYVHRLVAGAFLQNPDNLPQVNHKDENKTNNHVDNLEWCTQSYNMKYSNIFSFGGKARKPCRMVKVDKLDSCTKELIKTYDSFQDAANENNIYVGNIWRCCRKRGKTAGGFIWRYNDSKYELQNK